MAIAQLLEVRNVAVVSHRHADGERDVEGLRILDAPREPPNGDLLLIGSSDGETLFVVSRQRLLALEPGDSE